MKLLTFNMRLSTSALRGFTIIELLVTLAIFTALTGVVLANYRSYNNNGLLANASEDVVLAIRQAQVYGAAAKGNTVACGGATSFDCPYGVYFLSGANNIIFFADVDKDRIYDAVGDTLVNTISWKSSISIFSIACDGSSCASATSVTFRRPNPDAFIANTASLASSIGNLVITLKDTSTNKTTTITVTKAGQISIL